MSDLLPEETAPVSSNYQSGSLLQAIISMAKDPTLDVEKFRALLELQHEMEIRQAKIEFARALARFAAVMPQVPKNGRVSLGEGKGSYKFAKWEEMDRILRPLLAAEGFSLAFTSSAHEDGRIAITGTLLHRDGHSTRSGVILPPDAGRGRNDLQAMGSALSYGKRYCAEMLLNIVREGDDTDGTDPTKPFGSFGGARKV